MNSKIKLTNPSLMVIVSLIASLVMLSSLPASASTCATSSFGSGTGSLENPFLLSTETHIKNLRFCLGAAHQSNHYQITSDISFANTTNLPIGDLANPFKGNLDGGSHHLFIGNNNVTIARSGLFGYLDSATIRSLTISGSVMNGTDAGLLAGWAAKTTVDDVTTYGWVKASSAAGGLIGDLKSSTISNVVVNSTLLPKTYDVEGGLYAGGVVAEASASAFLNVRTVARVSSAGSRAGGLVATLTAGSKIDRGFASGSVVSSDTTTGNTGGLVGRAESSQILNSRALGSVDGKRAGGLVGYMSNMTINRSHSYGGVIGPSGTVIYAGGLVGEASVASSRILQSSAKGAVSQRGSSAANLGGLVGNVLAPLVIQDSYASGNVSGAGDASTHVGGLLGFVNSSQMAISRSFSLGAASATAPAKRFPFIAYLSTPPAVEDNYFSASSLSQDDSAGATQLASPLLAASFSDISTFTNAGYDIKLFNQTQAGDSIWLMCGSSPVLSSEPAPDSCPMFPTEGILDEPGRTLQITFNGEISELPPLSAFSITPSATILSMATTSARVLTLQLASQLPGGVDLAFTYNKPATSPVLRRTGVDSEAENFTYRSLVNNSTLSGPVVANLTSTNLTPQSFDLTFQCGGACDPSVSFTYLISITPEGGVATNQTSTSTNTATVQFGNLSSNVNHVVTVTVTQGGITSPVATITVQTPRPIATISAIAIADTSATLTVGCSNCGAAPSSFTVSATPVLGGGAAITSNTSVITGLTSETTYSFSVVVAFAGTTSNSVLWQGNPVRTLPFVPVISNVSPSFLPLGGGQVTVTGANFSTSNQLSLRGVTLSFTIVNGTTITFTAPSDGAGSFDLAIRNPVGTYTLSSAITYVLAPTLSTNSPTLGTTNGGTIVTLTGANLLGTSRVNLGTTTVSFTVISDSKIRFTTPATSAAVVDIGVVTAGGPATLSNGIEFTSSALIPVITSITPANGPIAGGTTVTVIGQFFSGSYSDSISAAINGVSGSAIVLIDDSTFTFVTPAHPAGVGLDFSVFTGGGLGILMGAFTYTAPPVSGGSGGSSFTAPEIFSFSSRVLLSSGGTITLTGKSLEFVSSLKLGGILVTVVTNSATSLTFTAGTLPVGTWDLELINIYGKLTYLSAIEVKAPEAPIKGTLIGSRWSTVFLGNSRVLNPAQVAGIRAAQQQFADAKTVVCYGYTTNRSPNAWATNHALSRATAVCEGLKKLNPALRTQVRLRFGESKSFAMRSSMQFWK